MGNSLDYAEVLKRIRAGYDTAFIDDSVKSNLAYKPEFVFNNYHEGHKVLSTVESELLHCQSFCISVAFITRGGIEPLLQTLKELEQRGIPGRILTTDYLNFSDPTALEKLHSLKNLEVRMYLSEEGTGFHTKGYIFQNDGIYRIIVGSSNMTSAALTQNKEWNTLIVSTKSGEYTREILSEFDALWNSKNTKTYSDFIDEYRRIFEISRKQREIARKAIQGKTIDFEQYTLNPNSMQREFIRGMDELHKAGETRALLISATGTGKTYASAFAMREEDQKRVLFLVHREQICRQALDSYKKVFGTTKTYGLLSGTSKDTNADYLFSTVQTMSKVDVLSTFAPDTFDTIIIDEVHMAGAESYHRIMNYFRPKFWLGMTATPERTDGKDIYELFDHNIAYEIRLQQALEENLLCPFHYFGITDLTIDGETADDSQMDIHDFRQFNFLTSDERVRYIMKMAEYYGHCGNRVKGLMFVSRKDVGRELSRKFNEKGLRTVFLSGEDSQQRREDMIEQLVNDDPNKPQLDYIITVDIFNTGVDIPEINQVVLLRPTQSPIIYIQQLGRGLRKVDDKEFVVVLDFIGNYQNNYMIPIALSGDRSYNKDNMRRYVANGDRVIPGSSTIHFDEISRKRIYASIDQAKVNDTKLIRENYENLKAKLGHIPALRDFDRYGEMDVLHIFEKFGSYYAFLRKYDKKDFTITLSDREAKILEFVSCKLADGKRPQELFLLQAAISQLEAGHASSALLQGMKQLETQYAVKVKASPATTQSVIRILTNEFPSGTGKKTYQDCVLIQKDANGDYSLTSFFEAMLHEKDFRNQLREVIDFGIYRYQLNYANTYLDTNFVLYQKYTYEDACRLLNWSQNVVPLNVGGYKFDPATKTFPVFVNYVKDEEVVASQQYEDKFTSPDELTAISKSKRTISSDDVQNFIHSRERGIAVHLFVRKNKNDNTSKEFYYLGKMYPTGIPEEFILPNTTQSAVRMFWKLDVPVREDLYEYITEEEL